MAVFRGQGRLVPPMSHELYCPISMPFSFARGFLLLASGILAEISCGGSGHSCGRGWEFLGLDFKSIWVLPPADIQVQILHNGVRASFSGWVPGGSNGSAAGSSMLPSQIAVKSACFFLLVHRQRGPDKGGFQFPTSIVFPKFVVYS